MSLLFQKVSKKLYILMTVFIAMGILCGFTSIQTPEEALEILTEKGENLNFNKPYQELERLGQTFRKSEVFFSGESHAIQMNFTMQEYFAKYFIEKRGVRYILLEASYSQGELLNRYLQTGDDALLREIVESYEGTFSYNQGVYQYYKNMYEYNKSLKPEQKFTFVGIDVEYQRNLSAKFMQTLLTPRQPSFDIATNIQKLKDEKNYLDADFLNELKASVVQFKKSYETYFGTNFFQFQMLVNNLNESTEDMAKRENAIIKNFITMYEYLPKGRYYGQFGGSHLIKQTENNEVSLAGYLNKSYSPLEGKVYTLQLIYNNCKYRDKDGSIKDSSLLEISTLKGETPSALFVSRERMPEFYDFVDKQVGLSQSRLGDSFYIISNSPSAANYQKAN